MSDRTDREIILAARRCGKTAMVFKELTGIPLFPTVENPTDRLNSDVVMLSEGTDEPSG